MRIAGSVPGCAPSRAWPATSRPTTPTATIPTDNGRVVFMCPLADSHGPACVARLRIELRVPIRKVTLGVPSFDGEEGRDLLALDDPSWPASTQRGRWPRPPCPAGRPPAPASPCHRAAASCPARTRPARSPRRTPRRSRRRPGDVDRDRVAVLGGVGLGPAGPHHLDLRPLLLHAVRD